MLSSLTAHCPEPLLHPLLSVASSKYRPRASGIDERFDQAAASKDVTASGPNRSPVYTMYDGRSHSWCQKHTTQHSDSAEDIGRINQPSQLLRKIHVKNLQLYSATRPPAPLQTSSQENRYDGTDGTHTDHLMDRRRPKSCGKTRPTRDAGIFHDADLAPNRFGTQQELCLRIKNSKRVTCQRFVDLHVKNSQCLLANEQSKTFTVILRG